DQVTRSFLVGVILLFLSAPDAKAVFLPIAAGDTDWQYEAPAGTTITGTPGRVNKTYGLTLTTTFTDANPKVITLRTTPGHEEDERFFMFAMNITNNLPPGGNWGGFMISTFDQIDPLPHTPGQDHPKWAHIHPLHGSPNAGSTMPTGPNYKEFSIPDPSTSKGIEVLMLSGGIVPVGSSWMPERIRLHDKNARGDEFISSDQISFDIVGPMEFQLVLQPKIIPEPGTLALMSLGLAMLGVNLRRKH
ncbi:MAG: PEP-CTERM sorting domain-containing protein, partial [Candidatus Omnitrophica bacterium]|nr:PEP-CTERM sorting domain-containing protein [Candidatus Omnitrophota bacterium]